MLACDTFRSNRVPPNLMKDSAIARVNFDRHYSTFGNGVIFKWRDNKAVHFAFNHYENKVPCV